MQRDTEDAAGYLREKHGLPVTGKTLRNKRANRKGPACRYFGNKPLYDEAELDRYAREDALQPEPPARRNKRLREASLEISTKNALERDATGSTGRVDKVHSDSNSTIDVPLKNGCGMGTRADPT
jgi:hypothetical protein